jgi:hypothetical protein
MKKNIYKKALPLAIAMLGLATIANAQTPLKVGNNPTTINANSVLEMESTNKGMLLPRVGLSATDNVAPLTAHVAGMVVYNTATAGSGATAVSPGYYYNDGSQWVRLAAGGNGGNVSLPVTNLVSNNSPAGNPGQIIYNNNPAVLPVGPVYWDGNNWVPLNPAASQPWYNQATNAAATSNTQNIYQMGNVGIGTTTPATALDLAGRTNGGRLLLSTQGWVDPGATAAGIAVDNVIDKTLMIVGANFGSSATNSGLGQREVSLWDNVTVNGRLKVRGGNPGAGKVLTSDANGLASWQTAASGADGDAWGVTGEDQNSSIFRNGNVGIGTAPRESFYIRKGIAFHTGGNLAMFFNGYYDGGFKHAGYGGSNFSGVIDYSPALGDYNFVTSTAAGAEDALATTSTLLTLKQSGNVGIGTVTPTDKLTVNSGTSTTRIGIDAPAAFQSSISFKSAGAENAVLYRPANTVNMALWGSALNSDVMYWNTTTGNVGIGTTTPGAKLEVVGQVKITGGTPGAGKVLTSDADGLASWQSAASIANAIGTVSAAYTVTNNDYTILCNATAGGFTLTLPNANTAMGRIYVIRKIDETNNLLSFSSPIVLSASSSFSSLNYLKTIRIQSDGSNWVLID